MMFILHVHGRLETRVESFNHDDAWHSRLDTRNTTVAPVFEGLHDVENHRPRERFDNVALSLNDERQAVHQLANGMHLPHRPRIRHKA